MYKGSIGSRVQLVPEFNWGKGLFDARLQLVQGFNEFKTSICSIHSRFQLVQGLNLSESLIGSMVELDQ